MKLSYCIFVLLAAALPASAINLAFSPVGNPGNANDSTGFGGVNYNYNIGTYDVTKSQYTTFLNAVAATDTNALYNTRMATDANVAGISQSGASGNFTYAVIGNTGSQPVTYVSWFDAARFCNWMQNGQPTGLQSPATTEAGAYTLLPGTTSGVNATKNAGAQFYIPSENEWYKAAFYSPALNSGGGGYFLYPTQSNTAPGNIVGPSPNQANIFDNATKFFSVTQNATYDPLQNYLTNVGAYSGSASPYGTFDQGGDVLQWNDTVDPAKPTFRDIQGGSWPGSSSFLQSAYRASDDPSFEHEDFGFRIASVPEPSVTLILVAGLAFLCRKRRKG